MSRVIVPPKLVSETRIDTVDFSPFLPVGVTLSSVVASIVVYSGVDSTPSAVLTGAAVAGSTVNVTTTGGVLGVIYALSLVATFSNAAGRTISYFLAIIPDVT